MGKVALETDDNQINARHHYVPQVYLKYFSSRKNNKDAYFIYAYERNRAPFESNIEGVACEKGLYTMLRKDTMEETDLLEKVFQQVENQIAPTLRKISEMDVLQLSEQEKANLAMFISLLYVRTPAFMQIQKEIHINAMKEMEKFAALNKERFHKHIKSVPDLSELSTEEIESLRLKVLEFDKHFILDLKDGESYFLKSALEFSREFFPLFYNRSYSLVRSTGNQVFIASDNPVLLIPHNKNSGISLLDSPIFLPLSPNRGILLHGLNIDNQISLSNERVVKLNLCQMFNSQQRVYANLFSRRIKQRFDRVPLASKVNIKTLGGVDSSLMILDKNLPPFSFDEIFPSYLRPQQPVGNRTLPNHENGKFNKQL